MSQLDASPAPAETPRSFGVFKPVGHVVISFPQESQADRAADALAGLGLAPGAVRHYSDREMLHQIDQDMAHASPRASVGQEMNLVRAHRVLAEKGYHWLLVYAADDEQAARIAAVARNCGAERAQHYGRFIIEELIERPGGLAQVAESPDRGLDAQPPSGLEGEAGELRKAEG